MQSYRHDFWSRRIDMWHFEEFNNECTLYCMHSYDFMAKNYLNYWDYDTNLIFSF